MKLCVRDIRPKGAAKFCVCVICGGRPRLNFVFAGYATECPVKFCVCEICGRMTWQNIVFVGYADESCGEIVCLWAMWPKAGVKYCVCRICGQMVWQNFVSAGYAVEGC